MSAALYSASGDRPSHRNGSIGSATPINGAENASVPRVGAKMSAL